MAVGFERFARRGAWATALMLWIGLWAGLAPRAAQAVPLFHRQTGQSCMACHAGGQFPELTPFGRMFKLTGYTLGERVKLPFAAMAVASVSKVADTSKSDDPSADFSKNADLIFATASLFTGGKITDHLGAFVQITYDPYAAQADDGSYRGHSNADNIELRYADRLVDDHQDLVLGVSLNNNPSVSDPWNTAAAWMQYVPVPSPSSSQFIDGATPYPGYAAGGNIAGLTGYAFWNRTLYGELGVYGSSRGVLSFMSAGVAAADKTQLRGLNPYWRVAWNHEWNAHALMIGAAGMDAQVYDDPLNTGDAATVHRYRDINLDAQYQYLLDPHAVTAQFVWGYRRHRYPDFLAHQPSPFVDPAGNPLPDSGDADVTHLLRAKLTYVYQARYGGSAAVFNLGGNTNTALQSSGFDPATLTVTSDPAAQAPSTRVSGNLSGNPGTRGWTLEAFWMPIQYLRVGAQYTGYSRFNGASSNYDGFGRNASDNNSLFVYAWAAY